MCHNVCRLWTQNILWCCWPKFQQNWWQSFCRHTHLKKDLTECEIQRFIGFCVALTTLFLVFFPFTTATFQTDTEWKGVCSLLLFNYSTVKKKQQMTTKDIKTAHFPVDKKYFSVLIFYGGKQLIQELCNFTRHYNHVNWLLFIPVAWQHEINITYLSSCNSARQHQNLTRSTSHC